MGLDLTDASVVAIRSGMATAVFVIIDDGYLAGCRIEDTRTIYPETGGQPFNFQVVYEDHGSASGYSVDCVLTTHDGRDVTSEYIEGAVDEIRGQFRSMDVEIKTHEGKPGVELVFLISGR
jgi:hypothetical protein